MCVQEGAYNASRSAMMAHELLSRLTTRLTTPFLPASGKDLVLSVLLSSHVLPLSPLPVGSYAYFASHKKQHSRFGDSSADLARAQKDYMLVKYKLEGYFVSAASAIWELELIRGLDCSYAGLLERCWSRRLGR